MNKLNVPLDDVIKFEKEQREPREPWLTENNGTRNQGNKQQFARVFVGNLSYQTSWQDLKDYMKSAGNVVYSDVFVDQNGKSKGCGVVEFSDSEGVVNAINTLNETELDGRKIFVKESIEKSGENENRRKPQGNKRSQSQSNSHVFVGNLNYQTSWQNLKDYMKSAGNVLNVDVFLDQSGKSKGCGVVEFADPESALNAINTLNETELDGRMIFIKKSNEKSENGRRNGESNRESNQVNNHFTQVFVDNLSYQTSWQDLKDYMKSAGNVLNVDVVLDHYGKSKGFAVVEFADAEGALNAINTLNETELNGRKIFIKKNNENRGNNKGREFSRRDDRHIDQNRDKFRGGDKYQDRDQPRDKFRGGDRYQDRERERERDRYRNSNSNRSRNNERFIGHERYGGREKFGGQERSRSRSRSRSKENNQRKFSKYGNNRKSQQYENNDDGSFAPDRQDRRRESKGQSSFQDGYKLQVKNLPYNVSWQNLKDAFKSFGEIIRADVKTDFDGKSQGFGFVIFKNMEEAQNASEQMDKTVFNGRELSVRLWK